MLSTFIHQENHRQNVDFLRAVIQLEYVVLGLRTALRSIEHHCVICENKNLKELRQWWLSLLRQWWLARATGLPTTIIRELRINYFGPFHVTIRQSSEKRWGFLFTCMTTRAVHLEVVTSMDTSSCVMGIERFIARRGTPSVICSDNGTNIVGSAKELTSCIENWNLHAPDPFARNGLAWKTIQPSAPHHGGVYERLVWSIKRVFYGILGTRKLIEEVFITTF